MGVKIKANDDRIKAVALAVVLVSRDRLARGQASGMITAALAEFRNDYEGYKAAHPKRDFAAAKELGALADPSRREVYQKLLATVETVLARIERNSTQFSSLLELDNFWAFNLKAFD